MRIHYNVNGVRDARQSSHPVAAATSESAASTAAPKQPVDMWWHGRTKAVAIPPPLEASGLSMPDQIGAGSRMKYVETREIDHVKGLVKHVVSESVVSRISRRVTNRSSAKKTTPTSAAGPSILDQIQGGGSLEAHTVDHVGGVVRDAPASTEVSRKATGVGQSGQTDDQAAGGGGGEGGGRGDDGSPAPKRAWNGVATRPSRRMRKIKAYKASPLAIRQDKNG